MTTPTLSREYEDLLRLADAAGWALRPSRVALAGLVTLRISRRKSALPNTYFEWEREDSGRIYEHTDIAIPLCRLSVIEGLQEWMRSKPKGYDDLALEVGDALLLGATDSEYIALARRVLEAKGVKA